MSGLPHHLSPVEDNEESFRQEVRRLLNQPGVRWIVLQPGRGWGRARLEEIIEEETEKHMQSEMDTPPDFTAEELAGMPSEVDRDRMLTLTVEVPYYGKKRNGEAIAANVARAVSLSVAEAAVVKLDGEIIKPKFIGG